MYPRLLCYAVLVCGLATSVSAADLAMPEGPVILRVSGAISATNTPDGEAVFDRAMLDALPQEDFTTGTVWTEGTNHFSGVPLSDLLGLVGANGKMLKLVALNDYAVEIPVADIDPKAPIIASHLDGEEMSVRDKGPLWLVFPFDDNPAYRSEVTYSQSIWQLAKIEVED
ncbi:oxidoreductase [Martelella alba]|uniref:Oxidoreductase n=1 Tax=Martelella alba TaxID=2590451 RepID=A0A506U437_9HYPH|nr:oxidoreductase [Martelella alba]TPW29112.1 oxidoreductase [Martelella alba]